MSIFSLTPLVSTVFMISATQALPTFSNYPVEKKDEFDASQKPAPVDFSSFPGASKYKTKLTEGAAAGPNFAGHYTVVQIGCGTSCQDNWLIDARDGKILTRFTSMIYTQYQLDSTLMVVNPPDATLEAGYKATPDADLWKAIETVYETWDGSRFTIIHQDKWTNVIPNL